MAGLSHFNLAGEAHMVDVGDKSSSLRRAIAEGRIRVAPDTLRLVVEGRADKGDVLGVARLAGIMAAKKTADLVPLCHSLSLTHVEVALEARPETSEVYCQATVETVARTGVEMEALLAVEIALLTVYDMCKAVDRGMTLDGIRLVEKTGGRSGRWVRGESS
jgi:cyclic pyranopterin phosphate synthase